MTGYPRQFQELYVVSDLHMGGEPGFQIFNRGPRLAAFVDYVAAQRPADDVALVLNGDVVDSLAEAGVPDYVALDGDTAVHMVRRITEDPAFAPVWDALAAFVKRPRRHLVIVVGNHDIELALPIVEDWIRRRLSEDDAGAQSRITFATHGAGFACLVGAVRVFCTHGNEVDEWNWVDYNLLGQLANAINAGRAGDRDKWKPNAGTRLVKDVMNTVKRRYPFVDLLKPETAAVAGVLMAVDAETFKKIDLTAIVPVLRDKVRGGLITRNLLGADALSLEGVSRHQVADEMTRHLLGPRLREAVRESRGEASVGPEDAMLLEAGYLVAQAKRASDNVVIGDTIATLGAWDLVAGWVGLVDKVEGLRRALADWLADDTTYDATSTDDPTYDAVRAGVADTVDVVITGHTHLARALSLGGDRLYFNCGTWIRLLRLTTEALAADVFESTVWPQLIKPSVLDLDTSLIPGPGGDGVPLLYDRTNAAHVSNQGDRVVCELLRVTGGDGGQPLGLAPEDRTKPQEVRR